MRYRLPSTASAESPLQTARVNTALFMGFLYLQDVFWLAASRSVFSFSEPLRNIREFDWVTVLVFCCFAVGFAGLGAIYSLCFRPLPKLRVSRSAASTLVVLAVAANLGAALILAENARYTSGGLVGFAGVVYVLRQGLTLASMVLILRQAYRDVPVPKKWVVALLVSYGLTIDGAAPSLILFVFVFLLLVQSRLRFWQWVVLVLTATTLLWLGLSEKFTEWPSYFTGIFLVKWVVARFSVQAEQMYTFLAGESSIGNSVGYLDLIIRSMSTRFDFLLGNPIHFEYPRNVSEALSYDMKGAYGAGSSPGILLGTALQGPFFFVVPAFFAFIFFQYFYAIPGRVGFLQLCAYSFLFKAVHADFSVYLVFISPTLFYLFCFLIGSLIIFHDTCSDDAKA